jgi:hypothetical protein
MKINLSTLSTFLNNPESVYITKSCNVKIKNYELIEIEEIQKFWKIDWLDI